MPVYEDGGLKPYEGIFDGQGHKIYGLKISTIYAGFFKVIGAQGVVKNLNLVNVFINVAGYSGCIVGHIIMVLLTIVRHPGKSHLGERFLRKILEDLLGQISVRE